MAYIIDVDTGTAYLTSKAKKAVKAIEAAGLEKALLVAKNAKQLAKQLTNQELIDCYVENTGEQPPKCDTLAELAEELADALALEKLPAFDPAKHAKKDAPPPKAARKPTSKKKSSQTAGKPALRSIPGRQRAPRPIDGIPFAEIVASTFVPGKGTASRGLLRKFNEELHEWGAMDYNDVMEFMDDDEEAAIKLLRNGFAKDLCRQGDSEE